MMTDDISTKAFEKIGGLPSLVKWIKESARNRSAFYSWYIPSRLRQPLMQQTNVNVSVINEEATRAKLQDALLRQIEARKYDDVDPVVTVNGERIIDHQPLAADPRSQPGERVSDTPSPSSVTANESPSADESRREAAAARPSTAAPRPRPVQSLVPGQGAGAALDGYDDNRSTTQKYLDWSGHGKLF
jgi:hypothetical protein